MSIRTMQFQFAQHNHGKTAYIDEISSALDFSCGVAIDGGIENLLSYLNDGDKVYCFRFQIFYSIFEKWSISNFIPFKSNIIDGVAKVYRGHTKNKPYIAPTIIGDAPSLDDSKTPVCKKFRLGWQGKEYTFIDVDQWIRDTPAFGTPITYDYGSECQRVLEFIIEKMLPLTRKGEGSSSIASLSRSLFDYSGKCTKDDGNEIHTKRLQYLRLIYSSYTGGVYYLSGHYAYKTIEYAVDYDKRSAYPSQLCHRPIPNLFQPGEIVDGLEFDDDDHLHFYHIRSLECSLKPRHFPTLFTQQRFSRYWGLSVGKRGRKTPINLAVDDEFGECMITSVDYRMLLRDYDITSINIDFSVRCAKIDGMDFFEGLNEYFKKKEAEPHGSVARNVYKVLIDSFTGSLAMRTASPQYMYESLDKAVGVKRDMMTSSSPIDVASFMTAYQRWEITEHALRAGYENVISIDTDSIFTFGRNEYLDSICKPKGLGTMHVDKEMRWAKWLGNKQYVSMVDGKYDIHITGLPSCLYRDGVTDYVEKIPIFDKKEKLYYVQEAGFTLSRVKARPARRMKKEERKDDPAEKFIGELLSDH